LDDLFKKVSELAWVAETKPTVPSKSNGWGKNDKDYHLAEGDKDFSIELEVDGKKVFGWTWENQKEAGSKTVPAKYWDGFLKAVDKA